MEKDPICGMEVDRLSAIKASKAGQEYFFCSHYCKDKFILQENIARPRVCCASVKKPFFKNKLLIVSAVPLLLILASFFIPFLLPFRQAFSLYLKAIWWAVLLGLFLGGLIDHYIPKEYISKVLARKRSATIFSAVFLGFLMSACSHGVLALSIQLHKKGASNPAIISFLLASPWTNFTITVMLVSFFGLKGIFIILAAILVAFNTGFIFMFLESRGLVEKNKNTIDVPERYSVLNDVKIRMRNYNFGLNALIADSKGIIKGSFALADMVLGWIILGVLIASVAGAYIPAHFFHKFMDPGLLGLMITLALATVIEICSEGSSPLAFEIYRQTGALGNSFVFLMAGVATDYTEIGLLWSNVGRRTAIWLPLVTIPQIFILGYLANQVFK